MIEATTASATALGSHLLRTAAAMIENLHPHAPTATRDKHLRPSDIPKTLYLPRAELFFFYMNPPQRRHIGRQPYTYQRTGRSTERLCMRESRCTPQPPRPFAQHDSDRSRSLLHVVRGDIIAR